MDTPFQLRDFSDEFIFKATRSSGPGGQNVNKVNSRIELRFNIFNSNVLTESEKQILLIKLSHKLTLDGELIIVSQSQRSQVQNKEKALEKFYKIIENALKVKTPRKKSKPSPKAIEKRLSEKKQLSEKKNLRKKV